MNYQTIRIGNFAINPLGMGGIPIQKLSFSQAEYLLKFAVEQGINFFDTARAYGCSEQYFSVLNKYRNKVFIATKSLARTLNGLRQEISLCFENLKTDYIDLFQLHNVASLNDWEKIKAEGIIDYLAEMQQQKKIRFLGITGHKPWILKTILAEQEFLTVQFPFNYIEQEAKKELLPYVKKRKNISIAMKPIGGGNIREIAANIKFIVASGIDIVIPGFDSPQQIVEIKKIFQQQQKISSEDIKKLEAERQRLQTEFCRRCEYCLPCPQGLPISFLHVLRQYYYNYDLKDWALGRIKSLDKNYLDCIDCKQCLEKCPYEIDSGKIFQQIKNELRDLLKR